MSQQFYDLPSFVDLAIHGLDVLLESLLALVNIVNEVWKENRKQNLEKNLKIITFIGPSIQLMNWTSAKKIA